MEGRPLLWKVKGVQTKHRLSDSLRAILLFSLIPSPMMLNVSSLKIVTEEYSGYKLLRTCTSGQLKSRMKDLASVLVLES
jgi:hypothetical protein